MSRTSHSHAELSLPRISADSNGGADFRQNAFQTRELHRTIDGKPASNTFERHYTINEISQLWGLSQKTVRRIFEQEPGVIELDNRQSRHKRNYVTRRIPENVLHRVYRKLQKPA
jgi:AraC-like DNA-binding protein